MQAIGYLIPLVVSLTVGYGFVVASVGMTWLTLGKDGVIALLKRFVVWRVVFKWYLMAFLLLPAINGIAIVLHATRAAREAAHAAGRRPTTARTTFSLNSRV